MECAAHNFAAFEHHKHFLTNRMAQTVVFNSEKPVTEYKKAAVLFLMREQCGRLEVLLTKRSDKVTSHIGENCLPGGMFEVTKDQNLVDTALRETEEEVGVGRHVIRVVAELPPAPSGWACFMAVTTVVGILKAEIELRLNNEVAEAFWVPVQFFLSSEQHSKVRGIWWNSVYDGDSFNYPDLQGGGDTPKLRIVWGLTATVCIAASAIAINRYPDFPYTTRFVYDITVEEYRITLTLLQLAITQEDRLTLQACDDKAVTVMGTIFVNAKL